VASAGPIAYVAARHAGQLSAINTATHQVIHTIAVGDGPMAVSVSRDGQRAYVTLGPQDEVAVVDTATRTVLGRIPVGDNPTGVTISPDGTRVYVVNTGSRSLSIINVALGRVTAVVTLGNHPFDVAVHPDGSAVYVTGDFPGQVSIVNPVAAVVSGVISVGDSLGGLSAHPNGLTLYVVDSGNNELAVVDVATRAVVQRITVGQTPVDVTLNQNGNVAYVSNLFGTGAVSVIDTENNSVIQTITLPGPALAQGVAITPDGKTLYVALRGASGVLAVNTPNHAIIGIVPVGGEPTGFGDFIAPSGAAVTAQLPGSAASSDALLAPPSGTAVAAFAPSLADDGAVEVAVEVAVALMPGAVVRPGDHVIYPNQDCIFVLDFATGIETPIIGTPNPADPSRPICTDPQLTPIKHAAVSRDRKRILFNVGEDLTGEIVTRLYLIDLPSRRTYQLLPRFARVGIGGIDFALNGDIYTAAVAIGNVRDPRVADQSEVFRISADLSTVEQITDMPNRGLADVSISPDGTKLAFNALVLSTNNLEVVESNLDGTNPKVVIQGGAVWLDSVHDPEHSSDLSKVVYSRMRIRMPDGSICGPNFGGGPRCHDLFVQPVNGGAAEMISLLGGTSIVADWKNNYIVYAFSIGDGTSPGSWMGSVLTDQHGFTMVPFGSYNLFAKWID
jgi:YVTN family beta-propeller protein